ncbi:MAG: Omp28-related outer membrane protein [Bacteroidales bacterium]|nr:Omp28-related outer membrane protein [Bacteroidales bacterium]
MKRLLHILLAFLPVLSCVGQKDDPVPELRLMADLTALNVTAGESATFTVYSGAEDVTAFAAIRNVTDGTDLEGNVFAPTEAGEWSFVATLDGAESEPLTVTAIEIADEGKDFFRRSLVLDFTGTWCVNCPKMEAAIEETMEARPGRIVPVSVHCMSVDPMYVKPLSDDLVRKFGVKAYPSAVVDLDPESLITAQSPELLQSHIDRLLEARGPAAGIRVESTVNEGSFTLKAEMKAVRDGTYVLVVLVLEDGTVAAQTGGTTDYVHNNILRSWTEGESLNVKEGDTASCDFTGTVTAKSRFVVLVLRDGLVDNVIGCAAGGSVDWQYEEENY